MKDKLGKSRPWLFRGIRMLEGLGLLTIIYGLASSRWFLAAGGATVILMSCGIYRRFFTVSATGRNASSRIMRPDWFSEEPQGISYKEGTSLSTTVISGFFSFLFLALTVGVLIEIAYWPWHGGKIAGLVTALAFGGFSLVSGLLAIAGVQAVNIRFDAGSKIVTGRARGKFIVLQSVNTRFDSLQKPVIKSIDQESAPDLYEVRIERAGSFPLVFGTYEQRSDAECWRNRLVA